MAGFKQRLARLEQKAPPPPPPQSPASQERVDRDFARLNRMVEAALALMSPEEVARVEQAVAQWNAIEPCPLDGWFNHLAEGKCALPEVTPEVMRELLLAWLSPECEDHGRVCVRCGLEYPRHRTPPLSAWPMRPGQGPQQRPVTDFFAACPGCGASTRPRGGSGTCAGRRSRPSSRCSIARRAR
jgi:hypothetical protein